MRRRPSNFKVICKSGKPNEADYLLRCLVDITLNDSSKEHIAEESANYTIAHISTRSMKLAETKYEMEKD